jgi:hypothetical protein
MGFMKCTLLHTSILVWYKHRLRGANNHTSEKITVTKTPETYGGGPWRRPRPTQGCSTSRGEDQCRLYVLKIEIIQVVVYLMYYPSIRLQGLRISQKPSGSTDIFASCR